MTLLSLDIPRIQLVCFDVDGTLRDTDDQFVLRLQRILRPIQFLFPEKDALPYARRVVMATENPGNFVLALADRLHIDNAMARLGDFIYRLGLGGNDDSYLLISGVKEMLSLLRERYLLSIVSSRGRRITESFLEKFELSGFFEHVATGQTCRYTKPHPDPILWVAGKFDIPADACLMVGDTTVDIRSGKAAGAQTVGVLCGFGEEDELIRAGADLVLDTTAQLSSYLLT